MSALVAGDTAIIEAWDQYRAAHTLYVNLPEGKPHEYVNGETAQERAAGDAISAAEGFILRSTATTLRGVEIQLWMGLAGTYLTWREDCDAARREDISRLSTSEAECGDRDPIIAAIRALRILQEVGQ